VNTSITYRITGLMFLLIALTVFLLVYLANQQMTDLFQDYVGQTGHMMHMGMGQQEREFLASVHQALIWVGAGIMLVGLAASYALARSITVPLRTLSGAVKEIARGNYGQRVQINSGDEVEQVARAFNGMAESLETNNQMRKRLLADIAHELRTPLAVIQGNLEGMLDGVVEMDKEQVNSIYEETVHLNRLIGELRDLSLAEAGQLVLDKRLTDVSQLVVRALSKIKPLADEKGIVVESRLAEVPQAEIDASRINQVVYNLLTNAIRYTPAGGLIVVAATQAGEGKAGWLKLSVSDTGQGIAAEDLPHIFDHFYRADKSRARKSGGSGIGLAIVKQLVEAHGGRVEVESAPGRGSCFYVYLPLQGPAA